MRPASRPVPTSIDIPLFIRQIATGTPEAAAKTIWTQNILGGMCARVCPTETLCEEACVREAAEGKPVEIGRSAALCDRHGDGQGPASRSTRAAPTGKRVAVVGAGPAGLACAHRLAMHGHDVVVLERRPKAGGLNEYGIASYKATGGFAQAEVDWLLQIGGIEIRTGVELGRDVTLATSCRPSMTRCSWGSGLPGVNALRAAGEDMAGRARCRRFHRRAAPDGGPVDAAGRPRCGGDRRRHDGGRCGRAVQAAGRRERHHRLPPRAGEDDAPSGYEQDHAVQAGVRIIHNAAPVRVLGNGRAEAVEFAYTAGRAGRA